MTLKELVDAALQLPPGERADLVAILQYRLDDLPPDPEIDRAWMEEIRRREEAIEKGEDNFVPLEEILARLESKRSWTK